MADKYQEALNELYKQRSERYKVYQKHKDWSKEIVEFDKVGDSLRTLQELVDEKYNSPTEEEEVLKEFEKLGYKNKPNAKFPHIIYLVDEDDELKWDLMICINKLSKKYWKRWGDNSFERFTVEEHQLLTKLFKVWGWIE